MSRTSPRLLVALCIFAASCRETESGAVDPSARLPLQLLEGDSYCEGLTPLTTCISLAASSEAEAQQRAANYEEQLKSHGWRPLLTGNQYARDIEDGCRAIVAVGVAIRPGSSIDWSELNFIYSARCEDRSE